MAEDQLLIKPHTKSARDRQSLPCKGCISRHHHSHFIQFIGIGIGDAIDIFQMNEKYPILRKKIPTLNVVEDGM